ncbi:MAG: hypothetical protein RMJ15_09290 [Nitrososphaerota archaeon]|nr:hypothetical protein [Candidatus Bathyarchaeota archaeon]MDW8023910.1 hypothetical protein [Nitrososphaerota archaeon]
MEGCKKPTSVFISLVAVFAAFNIVCDSFVVPPILPYSGVWHSWVFISEPITGIILGPLTGFFSNLVGVMVGHSINFIDVYEFLFTLGAPLGAMISALVFRGKWRIALAYYLVLLGGFFAAPVSWQLPFWGMWDVYLAFIVLLATAFIATKMKGVWDVHSKIRLVYILALSTFIGLEADVLFRIFVFVPCQTYRLFYNYDIGVLQAIWALGAVETPIKVALSTIVTVLIGPPIISVARKMGLSV